MAKHAASPIQPESHGPQHLAPQEMQETQELTALTDALSPKAPAGGDVLPVLSAEDVPLPLTELAQDDSPKPKQLPGRILAGVALALAVVLAGLWIAASAGAGAGQTDAAGSLAISDAPLGIAVEIAEPTGEDVLAMSDLADSLFMQAEHRELEHETSYEHALDGEILDDTQAFSGVAITIGDIEDSGYDVGVMIVDLETGASFAYNADEVFYSASSIKGPYVNCIYESLVEPGELSLSEISRYAYPIIVNSDNGSYANLHNRFGGDEFEVWLEELGYDMGEYSSLDEISERWYLHIDAQQLASLWVRSYPFLSSGSEAAEQLTGYYEERVCSALADALGERYVTWGKAGWYPEHDGSAWPATVDAGIVWAEHPYVVAVLTNIPDNMPRLQPLFAALDELHEGLYLLGYRYRAEL